MSTGKTAVIPDHKTPVELGLRRKNENTELRHCNKENTRTLLVNKGVSEEYQHVH